MKRLLCLLVWHAVVLGGVLLAEPALPYWPVDDVEVGMRGVGKTVMLGHEVEEFEFEVIGILRNAFPKQHLILARLSGLNLDHVGVISGMSGSPLYIEGRLLGAVGYGWAFSKEPIAGITPAEQMLTLFDDARRIDKMKEQGREDMPEAARSAVRVNEDVAALAGHDSIQLTRLRAPLVISGCPPAVFSRYAREFEKMGLMPVQGGGGVGAADDAVELEAGGPVAIVLLDGDMSIAGIGTVTERVGDEIIALGHPMMELGFEPMPMASAYVNTVIPSQRFSFKMGSAGRPLGTLMIDRTEGVYGRVGQVPHMIPLEVKVTREDLDSSYTCHYQMADNNYFTPMIMSMALHGSIFHKGALPFEHTLTYNVEVTTDAGEVVMLQDAVSSGFTNPLWSLFDSATGSVARLMSNPFRETRIESVQVNIVVNDFQKSAFMESIRLQRVKLRPGEDAKLQVRMQRRREEPVTMAIVVPIPKDMPEGMYEIVLCDAETAAMIDRNIQARRRVENYEDLLERLREHYPRNEMYVRIILPRVGISLGGTALPNLPSSFLSMLTPPGSTRNDFIGKAFRTSIETPYLVVGNQSIEILVEKEQ